MSFWSPATTKPQCWNSVMSRKQKGGIQMIPGLGQTKRKQKRKKRVRSPISWVKWGGKYRPASSAAHTSWDLARLHHRAHKFTNIHAQIKAHACIITRDVDEMPAVWKWLTVESESSPTALKEYNEFTQATQAKTPKQQTLADTFKSSEKYPPDSDMAKNITEEVIQWIALGNQLISAVEDQGFVGHLEFLNPRYALPSRLYITFLPRFTFVTKCRCWRTSLVGLIQQRV